MKQKKSITLISSLALTIIFLNIQGCKHHPVIEPKEHCFKTEVLPIFLQNCTNSGCHNSTDKAEGYDFTHYDGILQGLKPYDPEDSKIYKYINKTDEDKMPPDPYPPLTSEQKLIIYEWIAAGAKNDPNCDTIQTVDCDTTAVSYSQDLVPILNQYCINCHTTSSPSGGVALDNYSSVKTVADNGRLYGSIARLPGYVPMPYGQGPLDSCIVIKFDAWIKAGAPNN